MAAKERKEEGARAAEEAAAAAAAAAGDGEGNGGVPVEAQDLTVFVQSVMEQMVRENDIMCERRASEKQRHPARKRDTYEYEI